MFLRKNLCFYGVWCIAFFSCCMSAQAQKLKILYGAPYGVTYLSYKGNELVNFSKRLGGPLTLEAYRTKNQRGVIKNSWSRISKQYWSAEKKEYQADCDWGRFSCRYRQYNDTLLLDFTLTNSSKTDTFCGVSIAPFTISVDERPSNFKPYLAYHSNGMSKPAFVHAVFKNYFVGIEPVNKSHNTYIGFLEENKSEGKRIRLWTGNSPFAGMSGFERISELRIPPGKTHRFTIAVKFIDNEKDLNVVAAAAGTTYRKKYPFMVRWSDRRPIGALFLSSYAPNPSPGNPRNWKIASDNNFNIGSIAGRARFREALSAYADTAIQILKDMNAQGMITWDIEGQEFPHPLSYIGAPEVLDAVAPEMHTVVDEYFSKFRKNGFKTGLCIRPDSIVFAAGGKRIKHVVVKDPVATMARKIRYARERWGCTLFYIDSNVDAAFQLMEAGIFQRLAAIYPDILLIPEHENTNYFAHTAPYGEFRNQEYAVGQGIRTAYPNAFMVLSVAEGIDDKKSNEEKLSILRKSFAEGNILLFRSWYRDPVNEFIKKATKK